MFCVFVVRSGVADIISDHVWSDVKVSEVMSDAARKALSCGHQVQIREIIDNFPFSNSLRGTLEEDTCWLLESETLSLFLLIIRAHLASTTLLLLPLSSPAFIKSFLHPLCRLCLRRRLSFWSGIKQKLRSALHRRRGAQEESHSKMAGWTKWCLFPWQLSASGSETSSPPPPLPTWRLIWWERRASERVLCFFGGDGLLEEGTGSKNSLICYIRIVIPSRSRVNLWTRKTETPQLVPPLQLKMF